VKVVAITQARMTSTRLPGKVMLEVAGRSLLGHHIDRVRRAATVDEVVVATTTNASDDVIAAWCDREEVAVFRGSENDVLSRYAGAARRHDADVIVRVTSDCPLIDPGVIDRTVRAFAAAALECDYASNRIVQTYPRGLDTEVVWRSVLNTTDQEVSDPSDREHVTLFVWRQPERFRLVNVSADGDYSRHRWTVDTQDDYELVRRILEELYPRRPDFTFADCLDCIRRHADWPSINAHVLQKEIPPPSVPPTRYRVPSR